VSSSHFRCEPLACVVAPETCGARRSVSIRPARRGQPYTTDDRMATCRDCAVGAAHANGETPLRWADGRHIVRLTLLREPPRHSTKARAERVSQKLSRSAS
jgi:hypothetical protein